MGDSPFDPGVRARSAPDPFAESVKYCRCNTLGGEEHRHRECLVKGHSDAVLGLAKCRRPAKRGPLRKAQGRAPSGLQGPARDPSRMRARTGGAVHTRLGLNHSRPPDVSTGKEASGGLGLCWSVCGGDDPPSALAPPPARRPLGAASTQVVETIRPRPAAPRSGSAVDSRARREAGGPLVCRSPCTTAALSASASLRRSPRTAPCNRLAVRLAASAPLRRSAFRDRSTPHRKQP